MIFTRSLFLLSASFFVSSYLSATNPPLSSSVPVSYAPGSGEGINDRDYLLGSSVDNSFGFQPMTVNSNVLNVSEGPTPPNIGHIDHGAPDLVLLGVLLGNSKIMTDMLATLRAPHQSPIKKERAGSICRFFHGPSQVKNVLSKKAVNRSEENEYTGVFKKDDLLIKNTTTSYASASEKYGENFKLLSQKTVSKSQVQDFSFVDFHLTEPKSDDQGSDDQQSFHSPVWLSPQENYESLDSKKSSEDLSQSWSSSQSLFEEDNREEEDSFSLYGAQETFFSDSLNSQNTIDDSIYPPTLHINLALSTPDDEKDTLSCRESDSNFLHINAAEAKREKMIHIMLNAISRRKILKVPATVEQSQAKEVQRTAKRRKRYLDEDKDKENSNPNVSSNSCVKIGPRLSEDDNLRIERIKKRMYAFDTKVTKFTGCGVTFEVPAHGTQGNSKGKPLESTITIKRSNFNKVFDDLEDLEFDGMR